MNHLTLTKATRCYTVVYAMALHILAVENFTLASSEIYASWSLFRTEKSLVGTNAE